MSKRPDDELLKKLQEFHDPDHPLMVIAISPPLIYSKDPNEECLQILSGVAEAIEERAEQEHYDTVMIAADGHEFGMLYYDGERKDDDASDGEGVAEGGGGKGRAGVAGEEIPCEAFGRAEINGTEEG